MTDILCKGVANSNGGEKICRLEEQKCRLQGQGRFEAHKEVEEERF